MKTGGPVDVVEAGYRLDGTHREWLESIGEATWPLLSDESDASLVGGNSIILYTFDPAIPPHQWCDQQVVLGNPSHGEVARGLLTAEAPLSEKSHAFPEPLQNVRAFVESLGRDLDDMFASAGFGALGIRDVVGLRTVEPGGCGLCIAISSSAPRTLDARTVRTWKYVAIHLAAARRLRASLEGTSEHGDAVLSSNGRVEHAEGEAQTRDCRDELREAVRRQEQARGRMRRDDPERALEVWNGLVSGRWSLVDRYESDGRRYIVARRNEHMVPDPRALTAQERAVAHLAALGWSNKWIAYELGLTTSTVATHLTAVLRKLRLSKRTDLIGALSALPSGSPDR
jgi:DNA-binding CsgD family transcriptional regulator